MKSLYESILNTDFDVNDSDVKQTAIREIVVQSNYGQDDIETKFSYGGNQITIDYPGGEREFALDELVNGLKQYEVGIVEFKKDCRLKYLPKILSDMDIVGYKGIRFNDYNHHPEKIQLKDMSVISFGSVYVYSTDLDLDSKTKLDCSNLNLVESSLSVKARTQLTISEIRIISPTRSYKLKMKKAGLLKLYEGERNFNDYDFRNINPTELFFGQQIKSVYKIVVTPEMYTGDAGLVFVKSGMVLPRSHVRMTFDMRDNWMCYVCDKVSYDIY